jgi:ligand-binding sensor domain-containing protein
MKKFLSNQRLICVALLTFMFVSIQNTYTQNKLAYNKVFNTAIDKHGALWIATDKGALKINPNGSEEILNKESGLISDFIGNIFIDKDDNKWFLHSAEYILDNTRYRIAEGISYLQKDGAISKLEYGVNNYPGGIIDCIVEDIDGSIWIVSRVGIIHVKNINTLEIKSNEDFLLKDSIVNITIDSKGNKWFISNNEISYMDNLGNIKVLNK